MQRKAFYRLTVEYQDDRKQTFDFCFPPTRDDFLRVCKVLHWTQCWQETLFPIIARNDWPLVDALHKASSVELQDDSKVVGRLSVYREWLYENEQHLIPYATCDEEAKAIQSVPKDRRNEAHLLLLDRQNYLREQFMLPGNESDAARIKIMKQVLYEKGFRKTPPKVKS